MNHIKKLSFGLLLTLLSFNSFAIGEVLLENLTVDLNSNGGEIQGDNFYVSAYPYQFVQDTPNVVITKEENKYQVTLGQDTTFNYYALEDSIVDNFGEFYTEGMDLYFLTKKRLSLKISGLKMNVGSGTQNIPAMTLDCRELSGSSVKQFTIPCLQQANINIPLLNLDSISQQGVKSALNTNKSLNTLENISINISNGHANIQLKTKIVFNVTVKMSGPVQYNPESGNLRFTLQKAKAGFFSVKRTLLKTIASMDSSTVNVDGDHIYIKIGK